MFGARYLGLLFPRWNWGSHFTINKLAYRLLESESSKKKLFVLKKVFPTWNQINIYEGLNGADGLWLEGKLNSSTMHYNPINGQGEAPQGIKKNLMLLTKILSKKKNPLTTLRASRRAAYLSHLFADVLNPPHHFGRYDNYMVRYWWWLIRSDWKEEGISGLKKGVSLEYYHRKFEVKLLYKLIHRSFGKSEINYEFIKKYQHEKDANPLLIQNAVIEQINKIYKLRIYQQFINHNWNKKIESLIIKQIFPTMISWTATYWFLAILEAKKIKL
jgi:hypothetical protein